MKGYKYLLNNMEAPVARGFFYELNKWYEVEDEDLLLPCDYGYHFYTSIESLFDYMHGENYEDCHIYEIEADGIILYCDDYDDIVDDKYCSSKIRITKELSKEEIWKLIEDRNILYCDSWKARATVAKQGYGLDVLINDENPYVRVAVVKQGYELDVLINDKNEWVRTAVAEQGYGLDKLINDEDTIVRLAVAKQGYGSDILINDKSPYVRAAAEWYGCRKGSSRTRI